jgi:asparagine N-glycosylation enzyme membrane subunit Stt3
MESSILEERKEKAINFLKKSQSWVIVLLIIAVILGVYIRSMPMHDHGGNPGLWDVTRNDWTLGPDLDPWLFTRQAKTILENGALPEIDEMRNSPVGFVNARETVLLPYMIYWTHGLVNLFGEYSIEFAAVIFPVIMFGLTIIVFFLFVREAFLGMTKREKISANAIAIISTFIIIVIPIFLSRTVAGIPEKESAIFFFMFISFYLFLRAWKANDIQKKIIFAILAGVATGLGGLISGLVIYLFITLALTTLFMFILDKIKKENAIVYAIWTTISLLMMATLSQRFTLGSLIKNYTVGISALVLFIIFIDAIFWKTSFSRKKFFENLKMPRSLISLILSGILGIILASIVFGPDFLINLVKSIHQELFKATTGRWNSTVAENRQPFFLEWVNNFGPHLNKIPVMFWMFFIGSVVLFKKMIKDLKKKDSWKLTGFYILFICGLIFSRYSSSSIFNGENFVSKSFYYITAALLIWAVIKIYLNYKKEDLKPFKNIPYSNILLIILFVLTVFSARSAIRLVMVLGPVGAIFIGFLVVELVNKYFTSKNIGTKNFFGVCAIIAIILTAFMFINFNKSIQEQAYNFIPSHYNQQWQKAMDWARTETDESSVFVHWWDYGYWVQSIGNRATVTDGGNAITYWNYLTGRHVLTGDNQADALEFLYNHDASYLLIDSSDIGKYGAISSIGSDEGFDRYSSIPVIGADPSQTKETAKGTQRIYPTQAGLDEDIIFDINGSEIFLAKGKAVMLGIILNIVQDENQTSFGQPLAVFFNGRDQNRIPLRYLEYKGEFIDFGSGLPGAIKIIQSFSQGPQGLNGDEMGGVIYTSPRALRGYLAQKYIFEDSFGRFAQFEVAHTEPSLVVSSLRNSGIPAEEFVLYQGRLQGPITIWKVNYLGNEKIREEYQDTDATKYLSWKL